MVKATIYNETEWQHDAVCIIEWNTQVFTTSRQYKTILDEMFSWASMGREFWFLRCEVETDTGSFEILSKTLHNCVEYSTIDTWFVINDTVVRRMNVCS